MAPYKRKHEPMLARKYAEGGDSLRSVKISNFERVDEQVAA
jgi:hypothetical protein